MNYRIVIISLFLGLIMSCQETKNDPKMVNQEIDPTILDDQLTYANGSLNITTCDSASKLYHNASRNSSNDSIRPYYLMKSADIQRHIPGKALLAIKKYYELQEVYPDHLLVPAAYFMVGLTFDENLDDKERSAMVYNDFLKKYPDHPLSEQAENLLSMASDTLSELEQVHKWKENEANSSKN